MSDLFQDNGAEFSDERKYRYCLWRIWDKSKPLIAFVGLNPSTASESKDDPTIRRVKRFASDWGYGGVYMLNLFPYVTAYPEELERIWVTMDGDNLAWIKKISDKCDKIIFAWGNFPEAQVRGKEIAQMIPNAYALAINRNGSPKHPLYVKADTKPVPYVIV
jgi:hypothetical protein